MRLFNRPGSGLSVSCLATWPSPPQALLSAHHVFLSGWRTPVIVPWFPLGFHGYSGGILVFCTDQRHLGQIFGSLVGDLSPWEAENSLCYVKLCSLSSRFLLGALYNLL